MKKFFLLCLIVISLSKKSVSQFSYGFSVGANISSLKGDAVGFLNNAIDLTNGFIAQGSHAGLNARAFAAFQLKDKLSFEPGISFNQKGYSVHGNLSSGILKIANAEALLAVNSSYIGADVMAKINLTDGLSIKAGPQINFLTNSEIKLKTSVLGIAMINQKIEITNAMNKTDFGLLASIGYEFESGVSVSGFYNHGFSAIDKNSNLKAFNRTAGLSIGFNF